MGKEIGDLIQGSIDLPKKALGLDRKPSAPATVAQPRTPRGTEEVTTELMEKASKRRSVASTIQGGGVKRNLL